MAIRPFVFVLTAALMAMLALQPFTGLSKASAEASTSELASAMGLTASEIVSADLGTSSQDGVDVQTNVAGGFPTEGTSFAVLSTGNASEAFFPNDFGGRTFLLDGLNTPGDDQGNDMVQFTLVLNVPEDATVVSFDWKFYSEEWPEFVNSFFNDAFLTELGSSNIQLSENQVTAPNNIAFDQNDNLITINTSGGLGMRGNDPTFDCTADPDITDPLCHEPARVAGTTYDGATPILKTTAPIPDGATTITLIFSIFDMGDSAYDSSVFLDNVTFDTTGNGGGPTTKISSNLICSVPTTAVAGSSLNVSTNLKDATTLEAISGATIEWSISPSGPTTSSTTDSDGDSAASLDLTGLAPGLYTVKAAFAGDTTYQQDSCESSFEITGVAQPTSISISDVSLTEGDAGTKNFDFTVTRSGDTSGTSTVQFATEDGTAESASDYAAIPLLTLDFAADETTKTLTVVVNGDSEQEQDETFNVNLSNCVGCAIIDNQGIGTIQNDDFTAGNDQPIVNAGTDQQQVGEDTIVTLNGSASDPDSGPFPLTYSWVQTSGTTVSLSDATLLNPSFTAPEVGPAGETLTFELTVSDGEASSKDTVNIIVKDGDSTGECEGESDTLLPLISIVSPAHGDTITGTNSATIKIEGTTSDDGDGCGVEKVEIKVKDPVTFELFKKYELATPIATDDWSEWTHEITLDQERHYVIVARATDAAGNQNWIWATITVDLEEDGEDDDFQRPTVRITSPEKDPQKIFTITGPASGVSLKLTGTATDPEGGIEKVEAKVKDASTFVILRNYKAATPTGEQGAGDFSTWAKSFVFDKEGTYRIVVRATDEAGNQNWWHVQVKVEFEQEVD